MVDLNNVIFPANAILVTRWTLEETILSYGYSKLEVLYFTLTQTILPQYICFIIISIACIFISDKNHRMIVEQDRVSKEHSRVESELDVASRIQHGALPLIHTFDHCEEISVYGSMVPAKEVGGDFYDIFYIDSTHVAMMIADVSDKGVPAALFMMISKILLDNSIQVCPRPGQALAEVNHYLCEKSLEDMFVTVWLGILDLESGTLVTANGGHEYPMICRKDGSFEVLKDSHGLAIGVMDGARYKETTIQLQPGDRVFVYTDGVPESSNIDRKMFGIERTLDSLNKNKDKTSEELCKALSEDISVFVQDAPQFDDTTMLSFEFKKFLRKNGISVTPDSSSTQVVTKYIENTLETAEVPLKSAQKVCIAVDEVWSNVVNYSGASAGEVFCVVEDGKIITTFKDNGIPFNPLEHDADLESVLTEDQIGGLGIFMTRQLMTDVFYCYENHWNKLVATLEIK